MRRLLLVLMLFLLGSARAQGTQTVAVKVSGQTQRINNKEYYVHIVQQGQTLFSIARAYGLKYYDAVIKTDIHLMKVGDTVWLPMTDQSVAAVTKRAETVVAPQNRTHYVKVEAGQTLYGLSKQFGVSVDAIVQANPELRDQQLQAGQMLRIPPKEAKDETKPTPKEESMETKREPAPRPDAKLEAPKHETKPAPKEERASASRNTDILSGGDAVSSDSRSNVQPSSQSSVALTIPVTQVGDREASSLASYTDEAGNPLPLPPHKIVNPYPFNEVPGTFPAAQASFLASSAASAFTHQVRDRQSKDRLYVSVVMPLNLDKINEISTSKFDIEQRGKKEYKVFEFVQFYEGILMALDELQSQGVDIVLNVVDLSSDKDEDVERAFQSHQMANSDFIIALLVKRPFEKLASLARQHQVFVINPFSSRPEVIKNNPYVVKCMPSMEGTVSGLLDVVARRHKGGHLYIIHSSGKGTSADERAMHDELIRQLDTRKDIKYTLFDWAANGKLLSTLKTTTGNVILSIYDQDKNRNTVYATTLLNRLSSVSSNAPTLITASNYLNELPNVDFEQLQHLNYTTVTTGYLNYSNPLHKSFIDTYKNKFHTEPNSLYAGVAHDIMLYFSTALWQRGAEFWRNPSQFASPAGLLFPFRLSQPLPTGGYENQAPDIYQMSNYKLLKIN